MSKRKDHLISLLGNTSRAALNCFAKSSQVSLVDQTIQFSSLAGKLKNLTKIM